MGAAKRKAAHERHKRAVAQAEAMDRGWFAAHPDRGTYVRHANPGEVELQHRALGLPLRPGKALRHFVVVRRISDLLTMRQCVENVASAPTDLDEDEARAVWFTLDEARGTGLHLLEAEIRGELTVDGRTVH